MNPAYHGEAEGVALAMEMARDSNRIILVYIYTDNRGLVQALDDPASQTAQPQIRRFHQALRYSLNPVEVHWIPAHQQIPGNEAADRLAKEATGWRPSGPQGRPTNQPGTELSVSVAKTKIRATTRTKWNTRWREHPHGNTLRRLATDVNRKGAIQLYKGNTRAIDTLLIRVRTGKIGTMKYLYELDKVDSPACPACQESEHTIHHILYCCPAIAEERSQLWEQLGGRVDDRGQLLSDPDKAAEAAMFILKHGNLREFRTVSVAEERQRLNNSLT
jgi:hypothetical protein